MIKSPCLTTLGMLIHRFGMIPMWNYLKSNEFKLPAHTHTLSLFHRCLCRCSKHFIPYFNVLINILFFSASFFFSSSSFHYCCLYFDRCLPKKNTNIIFKKEKKIRLERTTTMPRRRRWERKIFLSSKCNTNSLHFKYLQTRKREKQQL